MDRHINDLSGRDRLYFHTTGFYEIFKEYNEETGHEYWDAVLVCEAELDPSGVWIPTKDISGIEGLEFKIASHLLWK